MKTTLTFASAAALAAALAACTEPAETGEATSAALMGLALDRAGVEFTILDVARVGPFTRGPRLDAEPCGLEVGSVMRALELRPVAILPGFVGRRGPDGSRVRARGRVRCRRSDGPR